MSFLLFWMLCFWTGLGIYARLRGRVSLGDLGLCFALAPVNVVIMLAEALKRVDWDKLIWERKR